MASRSANVTCAPPYFICMRWARMEFSSGSSPNPTPSRRMTTMNFNCIGLNLALGENQMSGDDHYHRSHKPIHNNGNNVRPVHDVAEVDFISDIEQTER